MSGFDNFKTDFYESSYSVDDQGQAAYGYANTEDSYNKYVTYPFLEISVHNVFNGCFQYCHFFFVQ